MRLSSPVRPTLSPASFSKEMSRLKTENFNIRDDIMRFRGTLQKLRDDCNLNNSIPKIKKYEANDYQDYCESNLISYKLIN